MKNTIPKVQKGLANPKKAVRYIRNKGVSKGRDYITYTTGKKPIGVNIFEKDIDMVIILDACRFDIMKRVIDEYGFITKINEVWSIGGTSPEWMVNTFDKEYQDEISRSAYITANPHSRSVFENRLTEHFRGSKGNNRLKDINRLHKYGSSSYVSADKFGFYHPVWAEQNPQEKEYYELYGSPRKVTDRAIHTDRNKNFDRMILHYMPPHTPYIINSIRENRNPMQYEESPWDYIKQTGDRETVKEVCTDMLRWGLNEVELLLNNTDREKVVITSDHGDGFGEFGVFSHHAGSIHPKIRKVPWIEATATDDRTYKPEIKEEELTETSAQDRLEALGYL